MSGCPIHFVTCTSSLCNLYVSISEPPVKLFLHFTTSVTFPQRFPATDILTVTLGRWTQEIKDAPAWPVMRVSVRRMVRV